MSDRTVFDRRKFLLLIIPVLLLLVIGWFAFAPGDDKKNNANDTNNSQNQEAKKDKDNQDTDTTEGQVAGTNTTVPSSTGNTTATPPKPKAIVTVASVTTGTTPTQTPPADDEETSPVDEPECIVYGDQIIRLAPGEVSDCYILAMIDDESVCWSPDIYALDDESEPVNLSDKPLAGKPYIVIENANTLPEDFDIPGLEYDLSIVCPVFDTAMRFHVYAPEDARSTNQPIVDYDYPLFVEVFGPADESAENPEPFIAQAEIKVDILDDETPSEDPCRADCDDALPLSNPTAVSDDTPVEIL